MNKAREIDELFLDTSGKTTDTDRITHLQAFAGSVPGIAPYLDLIREETEYIQKIFQVYEIQLGILSEGLDKIQAKNKSLEERSVHEERLFKALRELCIALTLDEEHTQILESASFTDSEEMAKVERALSILADIDLRKYKIRVAQEKCGDILECERRFLKRFVSFLSRLFVRSESTGELCVHRELYNSMVRYKSIYSFSKQFPDYYSVLCSSYAQHAKNLYENEFELHLQSVKPLTTTQSKISISINILLKSYESIASCEFNFLTHMGMNTKTDEIFKNINSIIVNFIAEMASKSSIPVILVIREFLSTDSPQIDGLVKFRNELLERCQLFESHFLKDEESSEINHQTVELINQVGQTPSASEFLNKLTNLYFLKISSNIDKCTAPELVERYSYFLSVEFENGQTEGTASLFNEQLEQKIIEFVFSSNDIAESVTTLIRSVDTNLPGGNKALRSIRHIVLQHAEEKEQPQIEQIFAGTA